jgi:hypothetical protein
MMLAVPYLSVLGVGFMIYRGVKKNDAYREAQRQVPAGEPSDVSRRV